MIDLYTKIPIRQNKDSYYKRKNVSIKHRYATYKRDGFKCVNCGADNFLEIDHIKAVTNGGKNSLDNYVTLCQKCNSNKLDGHPIKLLYEQLKSRSNIIAEKVINSDFIKEMEISKNNEMLSATDLARAGNKWRVMNDLNPFVLAEFFRNKSTIEFIKELESKFGEVKVPARGRGKHTWVHPFLFIDIALAISPKLKIETYEWLFDMLIKYRNDSGDSFKRMCGALFTSSKNKHKFHEHIKKLCNIIKTECNVTNWNLANQKQLEYRDKIQNNIALLTEVLTSPKEAIRLAIQKTKTIWDT